MSNKEDVYLNIGNLYSSVISDLSPLYPNCCIYKVPNRLLIINKNAYTPQVVSIGPHHHGKEALREMDEHKWRYLNHLIDTYKIYLPYCIRMVNINEHKIRAYYADDVKYTSDDLTRIVMLDAVFIIGILLRFCSKEFGNQNDRIYYKPWMIQHIVPDLLLLENQIPFFIIEEIYEGMKRFDWLPTSAREISMKEVAYKFFKYNVGFMEDNEVKEMKFDKILHFVDLGRKLCIEEEEQVPETVLNVIDVDRAQELVRRLNPRGDGTVSVRKFSITEEKDEKEGRFLKKLKVPTITKLHCSGVKFKVGSPENMFKIKFHNGILFIPKLFINDNTELFVRNIIAFEQCNYTKFTISNYFSIIKRLLETPQDLEFLFEYGIVDHSLGDNKDVFSLITKLADEITVDYTDSDFISLCKDMDDYCKVSWHKWKANLKELYFDTPWTTISVIAASIVLILTFVQTVCSILSLK